MSDKQTSPSARIQEADRLSIALFQSFREAGVTPGQALLATMVACAKLAKALGMPADTLSTGVRACYEDVDVGDFDYEQ